MDPDPEIQAMTQVGQILAQLDEGARRRVLRWVLERFDPASPGVVPSDHSAGTSGIVANGVDIADFFHKANVQSEAERALVVAVWLHREKKIDDLDSQQINSILKTLGYGSLNITRALGDLMIRKPRLMIQVRKSGTSKQARKKYRVTEEGFKKVDRSMQPAPEE